MKISHVLFKVSNLNNAVKKLQDAGFIVEYGTSKNPYNAFIWFEKGIFIEIFQSYKTTPIMLRSMRLFGYGIFANRIKRWQNHSTGWCEWSLENKCFNLEGEKHYLKENHIRFKSKTAKRINIIGTTLKWHLVFPSDIYFPFLMSAYTPNPRPEIITHPNGAYEVDYIKVGKNHLNISLFDALCDDKHNIIFVENKQGLQTVSFKGSSLKIEDILSP